MHNETPAPTHTPIADAATPPYREMTRCFVAPLHKVELPKFDGRGRPAVKKSGTKEKFFVSFRTDKPAVPRIEAHVWAFSREEAYQSVLGVIGCPVLLTPEID